LIGNSILSFFELFFVEEIVVLKWFHVLVELEDKRAGSWDVVRQDLLVGHTSEVLHNSTQRVPVSDYNHTLPSDHLGTYIVEPVGKHAVDGSLKRFSLRKHVRGETTVSAVKTGVSLVIYVNLRRRNVKRAAPNKHLLFAVFLGSLGLVETCKSPVGTLVESPRFVMRNPERVHLLGENVIGFNCTFEDRSVGNVKLKAIILK